MEKEKIDSTLNEFQKEKERIRSIVGELGGHENSQHRAVNIIFVLIIAILLGLGIILKKIDMRISIEIITMIGVLKIIWMFYNTQRAVHFQFWILNSIEFKLNDLDKRIKRIERGIKELEEKEKKD